MRERESAPAASLGEPDETGPLRVDEREELVDWITRHRAEAGAAWASRLLAAYDAAYDAVATRPEPVRSGEHDDAETARNPYANWSTDILAQMLRERARNGDHLLNACANRLDALYHTDADGTVTSLGEPAERPTLTPGWCVKSFYRVNPGATTTMGHVPSLYLWDFARDVLREFGNSSPSVSGSVRDEPSILCSYCRSALRSGEWDSGGVYGYEHLHQACFAEIDAAKKASRASTRASEDGPGDERQEEADTPERDAWRRLTEAVVAAEGLVNAHVESTDAPESLWRAATWLSKAMECLPDVRPSAAELTALRADRDRLRDALEEICFAALSPDATNDPYGVLGRIAHLSSSSPSSATLEKP